MEHTRFQSSIATHLVLSCRYQVLVNVDEAARLEWTSWRQFDPLPTGAISAEKDIFVARAGDNIAAGGLHLREQYGLIVVASEPAENVGARRHTNGDILVEHAPISHELADLKPLRQTAYTQRSVPVVGMSSPVLTPDDCLSKTGKTFNVSYERSVYFGRGHSIPTSAPVTARWADKSRPMFRFRWGEESAHPETRTVRLRCAESLIPLPEGTRVRVTLRAKEILQKFDFTATLRTHFADGAMLVRPLKGRYVEKTLDSFVPVFGKPTMALANVPDASTSGSTAKTKKMAATRRLRKADSTGSPTSMSKSYRYPLKEEKTEQKTYPKYKNVLKVEDDDDDTQMFGRAEVNSVVAWNSSWSLVLLVLAHNSRIKEMIL